MTSGAPDDELMRRWVEEANARDSVAKAPRWSEGRPLPEADDTPGPSFGYKAGFGVVIMQFDRGCTGVWAFLPTDPHRPGWVGSSRARAGGLSHADLLGAFVARGPSTRAAKLRWVDAPCGKRTLALFVGQYDRKTFSTVEERIVLRDSKSSSAVLELYKFEHRLARCEKLTAFEGGP